MKKILIFVFISFIYVIPFQVQGKVIPVATLKTGTYNLTLQWISWDDLGHIQIGAPSKDNWRSVQGQQSGGDNKSEYLQISGKIKQLSKSELLFKGKIETKIDHLNNGQPCLREGDFHFKATGKRKYWRLQEMENCQKPVIDYIDIYFK